MYNFFIFLTLCSAYLDQGHAAKLPSSAPSHLESSPRQPLSPLPPPTLPSKISSPPPSESILPLSEDEIEDQDIINKTIEKYGFPKDYKILDLPGPELLVDDEKFLLANKFLPDESGAYTLKIRTITDYFSYNGRYEQTTLKQTRDQQIPVIKGQFGEHFKRKSGGYYIRTVGYTLDENGYEQFLIDLTKAETEIQELQVAVIPIGGVPGAPTGHKESISSTVLGTLIGGNSLG